ncbi:hypothetical protein LCGC14_0358820 [marine sediment metagenome]|uniref:DUF551 domain-containing protein n=1 Tax=marine sediment metagenome TaxID=412755 RepID=A0A0F9TRM9_9ZZZZ
MNKKCPYNYIRVNKQLETYDCSDDCIIQQEVDKLRTQLAAHRWIPVGERLPEKQTLVRVRITIDGEPHIVRIRQMGEPHEWFNEYGQSTMSMKQIEENVIDWKELE